MSIPIQEVNPAAVDLPPTYSIAVPLPSAPETTTTLRR